MATCTRILSTILLVAFSLTACAKQQLFMAGDSTMAIKDPKDYPETGWGVPFATFFSDQVDVINLAKNGRSTRTFIEEGLWQHIVDNADESEFLFLDMDEITRRYFQEQGDALSQLRFMHIKPNTHPNYPNGVKDNTHFNELGAREIAQLVLAELKAANHPLSKPLRNVDPKHLKLSY